MGFDGLELPSTRQGGGQGKAKATGYPKNAPFSSAPFVSAVPLIDINDDSIPIEVASTYSIDSESALTGTDQAPHDDYDAFSWMFHYPSSLLFRVKALPPYDISRSVGVTLFNTTPASFVGFHVFVSMLVGYTVGLLCGFGVFLGFFDENFIYFAVCGYPLVLYDLYLFDVEIAAIRLKEPFVMLTIVMWVVWSTITLQSLPDSQYTVAYALFLVLAVLSLCNWHLIVALPPRYHAFLNQLILFNLPCVIILVGCLVYWAVLYTSNVT